MSTASNSQIVNIHKKNNIHEVRHVVIMTFFLCFSSWFNVHERHPTLNTVVMNTVKYVFIYSFNQSTLQRVATMPDNRRAQLLVASSIFIIQLLNRCNFNNLK